MTLIFLASCSKISDVNLCESDNMAVFNPRDEWDGNQWPINESISTKEFNDNLEKVFKFYGKPFSRVSNTEMRGACEVTTSPEMVRNFTKKAMDDGWLKERSL